MPQNVSTLASEGVTIRYHNKGDQVSKRAKVLALDSKEGPWEMLAVRVGKEGEEKHPHRVGSSMVIGLHFRDGGLSIILLNADSATKECWSDQVAELSAGIAFDRFLNGSYKQTGTLVIGRELLAAPKYELTFHESAWGDCLVLSEPRPRSEWKKHGKFGRSVIVSLSALFAIGPLTVHHNGRIAYEGIVAHHLHVGMKGEMPPFMTVGEEVAVTSFDLAKGGYDRLSTKLIPLFWIQEVEKGVYGKSSGSPHFAAKEFGRHLREIL